MFVQDNDGKCNWSAPTTSLAPLIWSCISGGWFWLSLCNISFDSLGVICHSPHSILCSIHYILWGFAVDDQQEYNWHCWIGYCASPEWEDIAIRAWKPGAMPPGQVNHIPPFLGTHSISSADETVHPEWRCGLLMISGGGRDFWSSSQGSLAILEYVLTGVKYTDLFADYLPTSTYPVMFPMFHSGDGLF